MQIKITKKSSSKRNKKGGEGSGIYDFFRLKKKEYLDMINSSKNEKDKGYWIEISNELSKDIKKYKDFNNMILESYITKDNKNIIKLKMESILKKYSFFDIEMYKNEKYKDEINEFFGAKRNNIIKEMNNTKDKNKTFELLYQLSDIDKDIQLYNLLNKIKSETKDEKMKIRKKLEINTILLKHNYISIKSIKYLKSNKL